MQIEAISMASRLADLYFQAVVSAIVFVFHRIFAAAEALDSAWSIWDESSAPPVISCMAAEPEGAGPGTDRRTRRDRLRHPAGLRAGPDGDRRPEAALQLAELRLGPTRWAAGLTA
ncbi:hypothetical protein [Methylobacterium nodulans]|uniref:hypothetical protein n=1 Tax=Methylobacterium nodulans TaxID=114616 RepID=UPI0012EDDDBB|nr:hypothetical protein [Methylobacterium nodulans]